MELVTVAICTFFSISCATATAQAPTVPVAHVLGAVDDDSVAAAIAFLDAAVARGAKSVTLGIHSPGGSVWSGFELAQHIERSPIPVTCAVDGYAASMASFILESCHVRTMTRRSSLMFHQPSIGGVGGTEERLRNYAERLRVITKLLVEHSAARMNISAPELMDKISGGKEYWLTWEEAVRIGAVDRVL